MNVASTSDALMCRPHQTGSGRTKLVDALGDGRVPVVPLLAALCPCLPWVFNPIYCGTVPNCACHESEHRADRFGDLADSQISECAS